jgi:DNA-binding response OmpR family regulator
MAKLLIVDDDAHLGEVVESFLESCNHTVDRVGLGSDALQLLTSYDYDAVILDWGLPDISGFDVCVKYRSQGGHAPVIFLTGNNSLEALEQALGAGADDYIAKPFNIRELYARLKTILRRRSTTYNTSIQVAGVTLHLESGKIECGGKTVQLRQKEIAILECLMRHTNSPYTSQQLLDTVWPADAAPSSSSVRVWMNYLRNKLAEVGAGNLITTMVGSGYIIRDDEVKPKSAD